MASDAEVRRTVRRWSVIAICVALSAALAIAQWLHPTLSDVGDARSWKPPPPPLRVIDDAAARIPLKDDDDPPSLVRSPGSGKLTVQPTAASTDRLVGDTAPRSDPVAALGLASAPAGAPAASAAPMAGGCTAVRAALGLCPSVTSEENPR
jgi:hypothetical protein